MSAMKSDLFGVTNSPVQTGAVLGVLLGIFLKFIYPVEFSAMTFLLVGILLALFGERFWPDIGCALISLSISASITSVLYRLIFGGPWF